MKSAVKIIFYGGIVLIIITILCGCATKTRSVELDGMYLSEAGTLAIGSVDVVAAPIGEETATIKYSENNAWLQPSMKLHDIKIMVTGTNAVSTASSIVGKICSAFVAAHTNDLVISK